MREVNDSHVTGRTEHEVELVKVAVDKTDTRQAQNELNKLSVEL